MTQRGNISGTVSYGGTTATFASSGSLSHSTVYTARITTGARDLAGNALASDYTWSFMTTEDFIAPTVSSTNPVNGDADVAINRSITAIFSEVMQSSAITTDTFTVSDGNGNISGTVSYHGTTATFTPSSNLSTYTTYTARITKGVRDLAGNAMASPYTWSFATSGDVDIVPPIVSFTNPVNGAAGVDISGIITATFNEGMDATTITTDTYIVNNGNGSISGMVSYDDTTATFTPSNNMSSYTAHTVRITKGVKDLAGNALISDYTWSFTTTGDFVAPTVNFTNPVNGAAWVEVGSTITAIFSETMDISTITTDTCIINNGRDDIRGMVSYSDKMAIFAPSANMDFNTIYTATITTGARDLSGNPIASAYTWSFTTESIPIIPTPTPTETPTPTPMATLTPAPTETPTPDGCSAKKIAVFPGSLEIKNEESYIVTVTLTGEDDCRVEGETVKAKITQGKGRISVSPANAITNAEGLSQFTIAALKGIGNAKVKFKAGDVMAIVKVKVVK